MKPVRPMRMHRNRQRGVFWILYAILLVPMIVAMGFTLDLGFAYTRRAELQSVADAAALAAARALNGTMAGITAARANAQAVAQQHRYSFVRQVQWVDNALEFGTGPNGPWLPAGAVTPTNVAGMFFARVDTGALSEDHGRLQFVVMRGNGGTGGMSISARAVAGRTTVPIVPLAVCAVNNMPATSHAVNMAAGVVEQELLEYGFRRGVSYNLLGMNPNGTAPVSYLVNPLDFPTAADVPAHTSLATLRPFVCNGTMAASRVSPNSQVYVREPFPAQLTVELNSRFNDYAGSTCNTVTAPPDRNIRPYNVSYFAWWMNSTGTINASAQPQVISGKLLTIADQSTAVTGTNRASYGPLWAFSKPVRFSSTAPGNAGTEFVKASWAFLYPVDGGTPLVSNFSDTAPSPYVGNTPQHRINPPIPGLPQRRVLNVPLLECPVAGTTATVLAIGRFLMTAPASAVPAAVNAEFGGLATDMELRGTVALVR